MKKLKINKKLLRSTCLGESDGKDLPSHSELDAMNELPIWSDSQIHLELDALNELDPAINTAPILGARLA